MGYFLLGPEVAGGLGQHTVADRSVHPPVIRKLHHEFDGWLGGEVLESFPCFLVTDRVGNAMSMNKLSGFELADVEVTCSEQYKDVCADRELPDFRWLRVNGLPGRHDLGVTSGG
jgi:hypothetical protein